MNMTLHSMNTQTEGSSKKRSTPALLAIGWLICTLVFCGLMIGAYSFPDAWVNDHVRASGERLVEEGVRPRFDPDLVKTQRDNYTEGYVLSMASHQGGHPLRSAFLNPYYDNEDALAGDPKGRITSVADGIGKPANQSYGRYWQGHLILERPLLIFMDLHGIYILMAVILGLLTLWAGAGLFRRLGWFGPVILLISLLLVDPEMIPSSTKFWYSFAIAVACVGWISWFSSRYPFDSRRTSMFFFFVGAVTVFLDFMSTPIITFMMSFAGLVLIHRGSIADLPMKKSLLIGGRHFLFWIAGWILLGLTNWLLFTAFAAGDHLNGLEILRDRMDNWTGGGGMAYRQISRFAGIGNVITTFGLPISPAMVLGAAGILSFLPGIFAPSRYRACGILLTLICAIPVLWCLILSASFYDHAWTVYRMCAGLFFTWLAGAYLLLPPLRRRGPSPRSLHQERV